MNNAGAPGSIPRADCTSSGAVTALTDWRTRVATTPQYCSTRDRKTRLVMRFFGIRAPYSLRV